MEESKEILSRQQLYDLVWSMPMSTLAKKYAISDTGLRKTCTRMNIPLPAGGHWIKLQFGKKVKTKSLPTDLTCQQEIELEFRKEGEAPTDNPLKKLAREIPVPVSERLNAPDKLIVIARDRLKGSEARAYNYTGMVETRMGELDIRASPKNIDRALRLMDALIKTLRKRGHDIHFKHRETYAIVKGDDIRIALHEKAKRIIVDPNRTWGNTELQPTGILCFKAGNYTAREWKDSSSDPNKTLETSLPEIIAWRELEADRWNTVREKHRLEREAEEREEKVIQDLKERKENELALFKQLLKEAKRWENVQRLRAYLEEAARKDFVDPDWLEWARKKLDWFDPTIAAEDDLLGSFSDTCLLA